VPEAANGAARIALALNRRELLRLMAAGAAAAVLPLRYAIGTAGSTPRPPLPHGFLSTDELLMLDAATAHIVPTDSQPGARECGVVDYIQSMLSFMPGSDANCDRRVSAADLTATVLRLNGTSSACAGGGDADGNGSVDAADLGTAESAVFNARPVFAGGPFSNRNPQPHFLTGGTACQVCHVAPAQQGSATVPAIVLPTRDYYPPDFFTEFLALPRLQQLSWKIRILGAAAVPEVADNPLATTLLEVDFRNKYRNGLAALDALGQQQFGQPFVRLTTQQQTSVLNKADPDFVTLLTYHTVEGMLCAPEYGGNRNLLGWQLVGFDGDSQPLGYEIYDETVPGNYRQRPDKPDSGPNPDENCAGFSRGVNSFLTIISRSAMVQPGGHFSTPYCFEVPE